MGATQHMRVQAIHTQHFQPSDESISRLKQIKFSTGFNCFTQVVSLWIIYAVFSMPTRVPNDLEIIENELTQGTQGKFRKNNEYCCFASTLVKFLGFVDQNDIIFLIDFLPKRK